jgi:hypothetical protein
MTRAEISVARQPVLIFHRAFATSAAKTPAENFSEHCVKLRDL